MPVENTAAGDMTAATETIALAPKFSA